MTIGNLYVGRRKTSIAKVKLISGSGNITINGKNYMEYVQNNPKLIKVILSPLSFLGLEKLYDIVIKVTGGGLNGQSDAIKLGIARNLYCLVDVTAQRNLRSGGFLTRNSLSKERRKYGLKKARKAPQFSKR